MTKGTYSKGKHSGKKTHIRCRRCGRRTYHVTKKRCAACGYGKKGTKKIRNYKFVTRKVTRKRKVNE